MNQDDKWDLFVISGFLIFLFMITGSVILFAVTGWGWLLIFTFIGLFGVAVFLDMDEGWS